MFDVQTGQVRALPETAARLRTLGQQIHALGGRVCTTLGTTLLGQAETLCAYLPRLAQALGPLCHLSGYTKRGSRNRDIMSCKLWQE